MDELPNFFDLIVAGTGMPECIVAAAAARNGKKVLHVDRNCYYGGDWASFSFDKFIEWMDQVKQPIEQAETPLDLESYLKKGEDMVTCHTLPITITNLTSQSYVRDLPEVAAVPTGEVVAQEIVVESNETPTEDSNNDVDANSHSISITLAEPAWTLSCFMENRRKFNIDLAPKIMFSRGSLVELLISSNIARYAEFQCITRVLTYIKGHIEQVPSARADVFSTKNVTIVEKRMLMKFLTFCLNFEEQAEEFKDYEDKPFVELLRSKKLSANVEHYIVHAIAMVDENCLTLQGLKATQKFLQSLGRYGKSPFLCTCYGSAELPQCFCRLCAVYEGMYYLKRQVEGVVMQNNKCLGIVTMGQRIDCNWLVMESSYVPLQLYATPFTQKPQRISRAILITEASICPSEKKENTLLRIPPSDVQKNAVTVMEVTSKNYVCPEELYLVYMSCRSTEATAEDDLKTAVNLLFASRYTNAPPDDKKPSILWCVYYNQRDTSTTDLNVAVPESLFLTSSPDVELDYEHAVKEAKTIFEKMFPGEEFLPRAPDPEDILIECQNNHGNEAKIENDVTSPDAKDDSKSGNSENITEEVTLTHTDKNEH